MSERDDPRKMLERVRRESETLGSSSASRLSQRMRDHFYGQDAVGAEEDGSTDAIEIWGRRIGRSLSLVGVVALGLWLLHQLGYL